MKNVYTLILVLFFSLAKSQILLDSVTVTANRISSSFNEAMREVNVLGENEIKYAPVESINEMLEYSSGLDVRQRGGFDIQSDIGIRGGTFDQTLILVNGMKMNDPQTGHHNMNLPITFDLIEQVEVLQGGASRVYGPNAFAGAINFRVRQSGDNMISARLMGGQYGLLEAQLSGAVNGKNHYTLISMDHLRSDGFRYNTDFNKNNVFIQSSIRIGENRLTVNGGFNQKDFGAQTFYSANFPDQFEATKTQFASLKWEGSPQNDRLTYSINAYARRHYDRFELFREGENYYSYENGFFIRDNDTLPSWYSDHNYHRSDVRGLEGNMVYSFEAFGKTSVGFDYRHEGILSSVLGKPIDSPVSAPNEERGVYTNGDSRDNYSFYFEHTARIKKFSFSLGALVNYNTAFGEDFLPGLDVSYSLNNKWLAYGSANRSFRFPTYTDLYYRLGGAMGSVDLKPEYSNNFELGIKRNYKGLFYSVSLFRRLGEDMIDWIEWKPDSIHAENITVVNMNGINAQVGYNHSGDALKGLNRIVLSYNYLVNDNIIQDYPSLYVLDYLSHKLSLNVNHGLIIKNLIFDWRLTYQERNGEYYNAELAAFTPYENSLLLDLKIVYSFKNIEVFAEGSNLLDVEYIDRGNVYQPGIWLRGGITFKKIFN